MCQQVLETKGSSQALDPDLCRVGCCFCNKGPGVSIGPGRERQPPFFVRHSWETSTKHGRGCAGNFLLTLVSRETQRKASILVVPPICGKCKTRRAKSGMRLLDWASETRGPILSGDRKPSAVQALNPHAWPTSCSLLLLLFCGERGVQKKLLRFQTSPSWFGLSRVQSTRSALHQLAGHLVEN